MVVPTVQMVLELVSGTPHGAFNPIAEWSWLIDQSERDSIGVNSDM